MSAVVYRLRAVIRDRWRHLLVTGAGCGLVIGLAALPLAGDRRTGSAYARFLTASLAADLVVDTPSWSLHEWVRAQPAVDAAAYSSSTPVILQRDGELRPLSLGFAEEASLTTIDRPLVVDGHMPRSDRLEIGVTVPWAEQNKARVGEHLTLISDLDDTAAHLAADELVRYLAEHPEGARIVPVVLAGIVRTATDVAEDEQARPAAVIASPAVRDALGLRIGPETGMIQSVRLRPGVDAEVFAADVRLRAEQAGDDLLDVVTSEDDAARVRDAITPHRAVLWAIGVIAALLAIAVVAAILLRSRAHDTDETAMRALGLSRRQTVGLDVGRGAVVGVVAGLVAACVVYLGSALFPIGPVRVFDPDRGLRWDGAAVAAATVVGALMVTAVDAGTGALGRARRPEPRSPSKFTDALAAAARSAPALAARRAAFPGPGPLRRAVLTSSIAIGIAAAVATAALWLTFTASRLLDEPDRYGWTWDAALIDYGGYGALPVDALESMLERAGAERWALADFGTVTANGRPIAAIGAERHGTTGGGFTVLSGRVPQRDDEVALGAVTARELHAGIGDRLVLAGSSGAGRRVDATVVGTAVLPALGRIDSVRPGLGEGAVLTRTGLAALSGELGGAAALVDAAPGRSDDVRAALAAAPFALAQSYSPAPTGELAAWRTMRGFVLGFVAVVLGVAVLAGAYGVSSTGRRAGGDIAVLRALGLVPAGVRSMACREALLRAIPALVVAVPLGVTSAVVTWRWVSTAIGIAPVVTNEAWRVTPYLGAALVALALAGAAVGHAAVSRPAVEKLRRE